MSYRVAVRALCEFTAREGDLDLRFTPAPTAEQGMEGHRKVAAGRAEGYETEITLGGEYEDLLVRGRADGYDPLENRLEEIKTYRGDLDRQPANQRHLHWAQARVYGWLMCQTRGLESIKVALVYLDIDREAQTLIEESWQAADLQAFFEIQCQRFLAWARAELARAGRRDQALQALKFPYPSFRTGQRELAETVYKAVATGRCLMAQATTGIGKTLASLFPVLKAWVPQQLEQVFFLTAKTPGRRLALDAVRQLQRAEPGLSVLRTLELVARDKACEHPDKACHGESCPLARGFYDRLPAARAAAVALPMQDREALREVAHEHQVCPYYLTQELTRWADVTVGDYNHYFDLNALLHGSLQVRPGPCAVLVDEAHNLIDRARQMYSASLDQRDLARLREAPLPGTKSALDRLNREWNRLHPESGDYQAHEQLPLDWLAALQRCTALLSEQMAEPPHALPGPWLDFYFQALQVARIAERFDEGYVFDVQARGQGRKRQSQLCLRNLIPARQIGPRLAAARSCILFSATLGPRAFNHDLLGLPANCAWLDVPSPFRAEQLEVRIASHISTRYAERQASRRPIAELIAQQYRQQPGNYLAFFSSFEYLEQVADCLAEDVPQWRQSRKMDENQRGAFIERFLPGGCGVGFAVLGGAFGEGIDLPGSRLIGAFVATLGLAQVNPVNEQLRARLQRQFAAGYDYTYLFPGLQKVVQAAGRVIRTPSDEGVVVLIDDRFSQTKVKALLPTWWQVG